MKYIIDSYLFSFKENMSQEELEQYLYMLSELDKWWKNHRNEIYVKSDISNLLYEHGVYPFSGKLEPLLVKYDSDFEYKDISRILNHYLSQSYFIEDICKEEYIDKTFEIIETDITNEMAERPEDFKNSFRDLLWLVFSLHLIEDEELDSYVVFSKSIDKSISINYRYDCLDVKNPDKIISSASKVSISCHSSLDSFLRNMTTPLLMWRYSICKHDLDFGLRCKLLQEEKFEKIVDIEEKYHFAFQDSFYKDYCDNRYASRPSDINSALDSIFKVIINVRHGNEHNMRTGRGGNNPYVHHNDFIGMRKNITTSIKLHYWKNTPYYQFAKIGEHDFFDLPWEECGLR